MRRWDLDGNPDSDDFNYFGGLGNSNDETTPIVSRNYADNIDSRTKTFPRDLRLRSYNLSSSAGSDTDVPPRMTLSDEALSPMSVRTQVTHTDIPDSGETRSYFQGSPMSGRSHKNSWRQGSLRASMDQYRYV